RRLLDLPAPLAAVLQAVRRRARGGDPDRRYPRSSGAPACDHEAAGRAELVPPRLAAVAPAARARGAVDCPGEADSRFVVPARTPAADRRGRDPTFVQPRER